MKRIHEYKRQLLNVFFIIHRYDEIKKMTPEERKKAVPRVCVIGGKAAPGYEQAKRIIKLVSAVADKVNSDPDVGDLLKLVFVPDYNVSLAEVIVPASELSQHISTAGTEASGTSNMKFAMNGGLIIGTMDGANVEIAEEIGKENMFIFGAPLLAHPSRARLLSPSPLEASPLRRFVMRATGLLNPTVALRVRVLAGASAKDVPRLRKERAAFAPDARFLHIVDLIRKGTFGWADFFGPLCQSVTGAGDFYLLANDFPSYLEAQLEVENTYRDQEKWTRMSILSTAGTGKFSSDRTIMEYAEHIWKAKSQPRPR